MTAESRRTIRISAEACQLVTDPEIHVWRHGNTGPCQCGRLAEGAPPSPLSRISVRWEPLAELHPGDQVAATFTSGTRTWGTVTQLEADGVTVEANPLDPAVTSLLFPDERNQQ